MSDTDHLANPPAAKPASRSTIHTSKSATVTRLLSRAKGASLQELVDATNWQPHSVRAFLSGLRKKGCTLLREARKDGEQAYRMAARPDPAGTRNQAEG